MYSVNFSRANCVINLSQSSVKPSKCETQPFSRHLITAKKPKPKAQSPRQEAQWRRQQQSLQPNFQNLRLPQHLENEHRHRPARPKEPQYRPSSRRQSEPQTKRYLSRGGNRNGEHYRQDTRKTQKMYSGILNNRKLSLRSRKGLGNQ